MGDERSHALLAHLRGNLPQADAIAVIGADGMLVNTSRQWPVPSIDLSDQDPFQQLRDHAQRGVSVSRPERSKDTGAWTIYLTRRLESPSGEFLGIVQGAITLDQLTGFYKAVVGSEGAAVALLRRDGVLLARHPEIDGSIGTPLGATTEFDRIISDTGSGLLRTIGAFDKRVRLISRASCKITRSSSRSRRTSRWRSPFGAGRHWSSEAGRSRPPPGCCSCSAC